MAHIVCITTGLTGILYASFELCKRLEVAGYQVTYACPQSVGDKAKANGLAYRQLAPVNYFPSPAIPNFKGKLGKLKRMSYKIKHRKKLQAEAVESLGMSDFEKILTDLTPDLLLIDVELHEYLMTAIAKNIPTILLSQWFSLWKRKGLPPLLHDTIPNVGWKGSSFGLKWTWWWLEQKRAWIFFKKKLVTIGADRRSVLKKYAQQIGFPLSYIPKNYWPGPFTYAELPVLSMTIEELEFPHDKRPNLHYVGAMVNAERSDTNVDIELENRLVKLFEEKEKLKKSLIYCSVSTFKSGDQVFLKKLMKAVEGKEDWLLLLSLGGLLEKDFTKSVPSNVHLFSWIPQLKVLAQADCSINHGGIHTINECVHFGVPMLVYSGKRSDQNGCAARVAYHGLGIMADKDVDTPLQIQGNIESILREKSFRTNVKKMQEVNIKYKKDERLISVLEALLKSKKL